MNFPMVQAPTNDGYRNDDFRPQRSDTYDEVMLKGDIKTRTQDDFTEQTGWIYWRKVGAASSSSSVSSSSSSSASSSSSSSAPSSSSAASSSKSTCIVTVPKWYRETGNAALFILECPEVRFVDWAIDARLSRSRVTRIPIEVGFNLVCEPGTIRVFSVQGRKGAYGGYVDGDFIVIDRGIFWRWKDTEVVVSLTAVRKGHAENPTDDPFFDPRMPERTDLQRESNEDFINTPYDKLGKPRRS